MPAAKTTYLCQQCGAASPKWSGQCPSCGVGKLNLKAAAFGSPAVT